jgi:hypothetical protein
MELVLKSWRMKDSVRLWVNISSEAREILGQVAARALYNEAAIPPLGQLITAMTEWIELEGAWGKIEENVRAQFMRKIEARRERDRERKRKAS